MKKNLLLVATIAAFISLVSMASAATQVVEEFLRSGNVNMDFNQTTNQALARFDGTGGTAFAWGVVSAMPTTVNQWSGDISGGSGRISIKYPSLTAGTCAYTRFDIATAVASPNQCIVNSTTVDANGTGAGMRIHFTSQYNADVAVAALIRSGGNWYQSSEVAVAPAGFFGKPTTQANIKFVGPGAVTWQQVVTTTGTPGEDLDQVDAGGEGIYTLTAGSPAALTGIDGMGFVVTRNTLPTTSNLVTNGTFTGNADGWTLSGTWAYGTDNVIHTATGSDVGVKQTINALVTGQPYVLKFTLAGRTAGRVVPILGTQGAGESKDTNGNHYAMIIPNSTTDKDVGFYGQAASILNANATIDNVELFTGGNASVDSVSILPDVVPPATPTALTAVPGLAMGEIRLDWADNAESDIAGYEVYRREAATNFARISGATPITTSTYLDSGLTKGVTYYYAVRALDNAAVRGVSALTGEVSSIPAAPLSAARQWEDFQ